MSKIPLDYYIQNDTLWQAKDLIGKFLFSRINGDDITSGIITETEAYLGADDRASHAWNNRYTPRTSTMYMEGGVAYVYLCYGIHSLFNIVTREKDIPHAILIRGIFPVHGKETMLRRRTSPQSGLLEGPGKVTKVLGIDTMMDRTPLTGDRIWLEDRNLKIPQDCMLAGARIGVEYAGIDAKLPYRFRLDPKKIGLLKQFY